VCHAGQRVSRFSPGLSNHLAWEEAPIGSEIVALLAALAFFRRRGWF
jgi:hypothetical protein